MNINENEDEKKCPKCGIVKNRIKDYYAIKGQSIKVNSYCKKCLLENNASKRRAVKEKAIQYLGGKCSSCGYSKCSAALEFHHLDSKEKDKNYNSFKTLFNDRLKKELDKCILLCSNCHREIHNCS